VSPNKKSLKYPGAADEARTAAHIGVSELPEKKEMRFVKRNKECRIY